MKGGNITEATDYLSFLVLQTHLLPPSEHRRNYMTNHNRNGTEQNAST